jgi:hypothetical protein
VIWIGLGWLRIETGGGHLCTTQFQLIIIMILLKLGIPKRRWEDNIKMDF